ncbi:transcriptional regulator family: Fungal Specific TF [Penicillium chermesinum]|uniref:Transcriptional regulator family: Fungal Specific TF n=1 Tax=Penicillium chermesinum TaxID=63820 RepID=A0A9W9NH91_9EURO|nr:transcriptional regulator family: Fungal Specific TF [Penicillium chermesinum]KAJ5219959.1 transcriptional regulator family: Fungal Specific TF [Penicillium chermesinum]
MNCVDAHVECLRTRQTRVHRPRVSRLDALAERLARLEKTGHGAPNIASPVSLAANHEAIRSLPSPPKAHQYNQVSTSKRKYPTTNSSVSSSVSPSALPEPKRKASIGTVAGFRTERQSPNATHQATEAREYLDHELQCNPALSQDRRGALEAARKFVGQLSNPRFTRGAEVEEEFDTDEDLPRPTFTPELLYMMLPGADGVTNSQNLWIWPDHISSKTLERMGLAIIEGTENEHTLLYYRVIVWTKVITFLLGLIIVTPSEPLREHFKYLQRQYRAAAFRDLNSISVSAPPSLILLQALLSGVSPANPPLSWLSAYPCKKRLMQYLGNQSRCWMFVSYAAKVIVALGYHNITNTVPQDDVEDEIHACLYTCFYFDNTLSLLLLRPMSMPKLKVNPVDLVHMSGELPFKPIISGIVELACLKDTLLPILLGTTPMSAKEKANVLSDLMTQTKEVHSRLQVQRKHQELQFASAWGHLEGSWLSMDFNYYSTMTTIIRARSSVLKSRPVCEDCLYAARKASTTLRTLQQLFSTQVSDTGYPYFLTWTILLFPLTPFFVLFCNVVATSDHKDFEMMRNTTNDLRQFAEIHPPFRKLYGLFSKFMDLCAPLMENTQRPPSASLLPAQNGPNNAHLAPPYPDIYDRSVHQPNLLPSPIASKADSGAVEGWDDSLMWELFDNQPTIGWAESGLWDAMIQMGP